MRARARASVCVCVCVCVVCVRACVCACVRACVCGVCVSVCLCARARASAPACVRACVRAWLWHLPNLRCQRLHVQKLCKRLALGPVQVKLSKYLIYIANTCRSILSQNGACKDVSNKKKELVR